MVDAIGLGPIDRKIMGVRVLSLALSNNGNNQKKPFKKDCWRSIFDLFSAQ